MNIVIEAALVSVESALPVNVLVYDLGDVHLVRTVHMEGTDAATALYQRDNGALAGMARLAALRPLGNHCLVAKIGFVHFDRLAIATNRATLTITHGFTNAMRKEPCRLERDFQHAMKLVGADTLLAGAHKMDSLEPLVKRDMAFLEYRSNANCELLAALSALLQTVTFNAFRFFRRLGVDAF